MRTVFAYPNPTNDPANVRNIAISNGNECAIDQEFAPGSSLLYHHRSTKTRFIRDLIFMASGLGLSAIGAPPILTIPLILPGSNKFELTIDVRFLANGGGNQVYYGNIKLTKKVLWIAPVSINIANKTYNAPSGLLPFDTYPGGFYTISLDNQPGGVSRDWMFSYDNSFYIQHRFSYIPITSSLDIGQGNVAITNTEYTARYIGSTPPAAPFNTPFRNFTTAFNSNNAPWLYDNTNTLRLNNEPHEWFFLRTANWLAAEMAVNNPVPQFTNCSVLCNTPIIAGPTVVCTSSASYFAPNVAGATYTWIPGAGITINGSAANSSVNVNFETSSSFRQLRVIVNTPNCGSFDRSLSINVGTAPPNVSCNDVGNGTCTIILPRCQELYNTENAYSIPNWNGDGSNRWLWEVYGGKFRGVNNTSQISEHYDYVRYVTPDPGTNSCSISIKPMSVCGFTSSNMPFQYVVVKTTQQCSGRFSVSPNPATSTFNISPVKNTSSFSNEKSASTDDFTTVEIRDKFGNLKKVLKYLQGTKFASINISSLPTDTYIVRIMTDKTSEEHKLNVIR